MSFTLFYLDVASCDLDGDVNRDFVKQGPLLRVCDWEVHFGTFCLLCEWWVCLASGPIGQGAM